MNLSANHIRAKQVQKDAIDTDLRVEVTNNIASSKLGKPLIEALKVVLDSDKPFEWHFTPEGELVLVSPRNRALVLNAKTEIGIGKSKEAGLEWFDFKYSSVFWLIEDYGVALDEDVEFFVQEWIAKNN